MPPSGRRKRLQLLLQPRLLQNPVAVLHWYLSMVPEAVQETVVKTVVILLETQPRTNLLRPPLLQLQVCPEIRILQLLNSAKHANFKTSNLSLSLSLSLTHTPKRTLTFIREWPMVQILRVRRQPADQPQHWEQHPVKCSNFVGPVVVRKATIPTLPTLPDEC